MFMKEMNLIKKRDLEYFLEKSENSNVVVLELTEEQMLCLDYSKQQTGTNLIYDRNIF